MARDVRLHALRIRFVDKNDHFISKEEVVYNDGFDETNATLFETTNSGCTTAKSAIELGRYYLAKYPNGFDYTRRTTK